MTTQYTQRDWIRWPRRGDYRVVAMAIGLLCCIISGCAALTNPLAKGIPVRVLSEEMFAEPKGDKEPLHLALLRQKPADVYRLAPGDLLGVFIDGVLGRRDELPPVHVGADADLLSAMGFPILVRENGTVALPLVGAVPVQGMSIDEAENAIIRAYTVDNQIIAPGGERIIVTLMRARKTRVLVIREDSPNGGSDGTQRTFLGRAVTAEPAGKGTGTVVDLPAYQNDVLNALAKTGGLPGKDAVNEIVIQRGYMKMSGDELRANEEHGEEIRIPLRVGPGEELPFGPEDIILHTGDIVLVEARENELFFTGGLLPSGEHVLPRDRDLSVVEAIAQVGGPLVNGGFGGSNLSGSILTTGIGNPSPSLLTVVRRAENGTEVPIRVDLNLAVSDPREDIVVKAGDLLVLQETPGEAIARYFTSIFDFTYIHSGTKWTAGAAGP